MSRVIPSVTRDDYLTDDELVSLFTWIAVHERNPRWTDRCALARLAICQGLRVSEMAHLKVKDCSIDGMIQVRNGKGKPRKRQPETTGRGHTPHHRQVRVSPEYKPHYLARLEKVKGQELFFQPPHASKPYNRRTLWLWWTEVLDAAGIRHLGIHAARHTFATWELASGRLLPHEVQAQLGHTDVTMTLGMYSHCTEMIYKRDTPPQWWAVALNEPEEGRLLRAV